MTHGGGTIEVPLDVWMGRDSDLAFVNADAHVWYEAHDADCECEALCECSA